MKPREAQPPLAAERIDRILVASTLDPSSERVVRAAGLLAKALKARLALVHALGPPEVSSWIPLLKQKATRRIEERHRELLREQAVELDLPDCQFLIPTGLPEVGISQACKEVGADLIVIGATTATSPVEGLLGSTAEHLVRKATRPILVIRRELAIPPSRILAPVDLSILSTEAFHVGLRILERIVGDEPVRVEILLVLDPEKRLDDQASDPEQEEKLAEDRLAKLIAETAVTENIQFETHIVAGEPGRQIISRAREIKPDLVVLGTRGQSGLRSLFGSVAAYVLRHAQFNLLMIPRGVAEGEAIAEAIYEQTVPTPARPR